MMFAKFNPKNLPEVLKCGPMKLGRCYVEDVLDMNPYEEIKDYENDVLFVHGTADKIVDIKYAREDASIYKKESRMRLEKS